MSFSLGHVNYNHCQKKRKFNSESIEFNTNKIAYNYSPIENICDYERMFPGHIHEDTKNITTNLIQLPNIYFIKQNEMVPPFIEPTTQEIHRRCIQAKKNKSFAVNKYKTKTDFLDTSNLSFYNTSSKLLDNHDRTGKYILYDPKPQYILSIRYFNQQCFKYLKNLKYHKLKQKKKHLKSFNIMLQNLSKLNFYYGIKQRRHIMKELRNRDKRRNILIQLSDNNANPPLYKTKLPKESEKIEKIIDHIQTFYDEISNNLKINDKKSLSQLNVINPTQYRDLSTVPWKKKELEYLKSKCWYQLSILGNVDWLKVPHTLFRKHLQLMIYFLTLEYIDTNPFANIKNPFIKFETIDDEVVLLQKV